MSTLTKKLLALLLALQGTVALAQALPSSTVEVPQPQKIHQIRLSMSNVFLIGSGTRWVMIDAGAPSDMKALEAALRERGLSLGHVSLVVLTHGHGDHVGLAAEMIRRGKPVALGAADVDLARAGKNDELKPTSFSARLVKLFADVKFEPYRPTILISEELDLKPYGVSGTAKVLPPHPRITRCDSKRGGEGGVCRGHDSWGIHGWHVQAHGCERALFPSRYG